MNRKQLKKEKKRRSRKRILYTLLSLFIVVAGFGIYFVYQTLQAASESYNDLGREKSELREEQVSIKSDPISILLMGIEDYETGGVNGRTDTLIVLTYNPELNTVKMMSIPRDTLVEIVGYDRDDKINHAHAFGGKEMTINTVEKFLDIPIDYYAAVDFDAFIDIVDILGGVTVNVPFDFHQKTMAPNSYYVYFNEGPQRVNGEEALAFVRMRKMDPRGDIGRTERQQEFIRAVVDEALQFKSITKVDDIANVIGERVETNVKISEGISMFLNLTGFSSDNIESVKLDTVPETINGISYQIAITESLEEAKLELKEHLELIEPRNLEDGNTHNSENES